MFAPLVYVLSKRRQRFTKFEENLPEALDLMVNALRAGHSLTAAIGLVARESPDPIGGEFRICFDEQNYGLELRTAMENLVTRVPLQDLSIVATGILIQKESGGNLAEVLDKASQRDPGAVPPAPPDPRPHGARPHDGMDPDFPAGCSGNRAVPR